jgi:hypothetical protein
MVTNVKDVMVANVRPTGAAQMSNVPQRPQVATESVQNPQAAPASFASVDVQPAGAQPLSDPTDARLDEPFAYVRGGHSQPDDDQAFGYVLRQLNWATPSLNNPTTEATAQPVAQPDDEQLAKNPTTEATAQPVAPPDDENVFLELVGWTKSQLYNPTNEN